MRFDRGFRNGQVIGNLFVQLTFADQLQDAGLLICQRRKPIDRVGVFILFNIDQNASFGHKNFAGMHCLECQAKHIALAVLGYITRCARLNHLTDNTIIRHRGHHNNRGIRGSLQTDKAVQPLHIRQVEVQHDRVRFQPP